MELVLFVSFFTGVISILSPCILPILPIFIGFNLKKRKNTEIISFILGLFAIFIIILFATVYFTIVIHKYLNYIRVISAVFLLLIGGFLLTDYSFNFPTLTYKNQDNAFILGFLTSLSWAPCYSGYLISLLALLVNSGNPAVVAVNILVYCLGFGLTLLVLGYALSKIDLTRFVDKSLNIQKIFAVLIIIGAVYMLITALGGVL
ncbi:cytochrome c biogenesis CcdA family protein [Methanobrevibacter sp.]|uniref:cytochrome c biogenesis CcdA family protein n=1 Tax=Methanobrevibacter sp. TaxID=66852 RepID=UPI0026DEF8A8|nr:cytochrome c biogenesis protein CcdA [Methanobrevibacter sp.]MDO5823322.1 cytochrome c biogenesis protein CcdA [Methanobrevibacter sp.]